jgi:hypothetical protein
MAKVLGKAGRYVEDQTVRKAQQFVLYCLIGVSVCAVASGFLLARSFGAIKVSPWVSIPFLFLTVGLILLGNQLLRRKTDALERERISFRKGAVGEALIGYILEGLPDDYCVLNDLTTPFGNIDHVVVGPTGVFAIDAKNWRGIVDSDGSGELLINGNPTNKNEVKRLVATCAETKKKIKTLCNYEPFIRAVLAFTSAHVEAKFGSVKYADCVRDERLLEYIRDKHNARTLTKEQIDNISRAFLALAQMDRKFGAAPEEPKQS